MSRKFRNLSVTDLSDKELLTTYENSDIVTHKLHFNRDKYLSIDEKIELLDLEAIRAELLEFNRNFWTTGTEKGITKAIKDALAWHKLQSLIRTQMLYYDEVIDLIRILELSNDEIWKRKEKLGQLYMYTQIKLGGEMNIQSLAELEEEPKQPWYSSFYKEEEKIEKIPNSTQILEIENALEEVPQIKKKVCEYIRKQIQEFRAIEDILEKFRAIELKHDLLEEENSTIIDVEDEKSSNTESIKRYLSRTLDLTQFEEVNLKTQFEEEEEEDEEEDGEEEEEKQDENDKYFGQGTYGKGTWLDNKWEPTLGERLYDSFWGLFGEPPYYT